METLQFLSLAISLSFFLSLLFHAMHWPQVAAPSLVSSSLRWSKSFVTLTCCERGRIQSPSFLVSTVLIPDYDFARASL